MIELSVEALPDQQFATIFENRRVTLRLLWNVSADTWSLDVSVDDLPVLHGREIVTGSDLLRSIVSQVDLGVLFAAIVTPGSAPDWVGLTTGGVRLYHASRAEYDGSVS